MNFWNYLSEQVSTIYLPSGNRPMLPSMLSDSLFSLTENKTRFALQLSLLIENGEVTRLYIFDSAIKLYKNYVYDSIELLEDENYQKLLDTVCNMNTVNPYLDDILVSHDVVAYLMITMNYLSALELNRNNIGLFRNVEESEKSIEIPSELPVKVRKFIKNFKSSGGKYSREMRGHVSMTLDAYTHITSPIRRLVDLLNIMILQDTLRFIHCS